MKRPKADIPSAEALLAPARATRETMESEAADFVPIVLFAPRHGKPVMALLEGDGTLGELVGEMLTGMRRELGPAMWIAVTADAYVKQTPEPVDTVRGELAAAFADGDPEVGEQMIVVLKHYDGRTEMAAQTYRHIPSEGFEWDEPEVFTDYRGGIVEVMGRYI